MGGGETLLRPSGYAIQATGTSSAAASRPRVEASPFRRLFSRSERYPWPIPTGFVEQHAVFADRQAIAFPSGKPFHIAVSLDCVSGESRFDRNLSGQRESLELSRRGRGKIKRYYRESL